MLHDLDPHTDFVPRHIGPSPDDQQKMLQAIGSGSVDDLVAEVVPTGILKREPLDLPASRSEPDVLADLRQVASRNQVFRSYRSEERRVGKECVSMCRSRWSPFH